MELLKDFPAVEWAHPLEGGKLPHYKNVSGAIFLGSRHCVHDNPGGLSYERAWLDQLIDQSIPVIGICFGAQLIALASGGKVIRGARPERGAGYVSPVLGQDVLREQMDVMQWHEDGIFDLPSSCRRIAYGCDIYPEQVFSFQNALGIQFHPETTPQMLGRWLAGVNAAHLNEEERRILLDRLANMKCMRAWFKRTTQQWFIKN